MVTEIVRWCSIHYARDEKVTAQGVALSVGGKPQILDVCPECFDEYVKPLKALLDEYGTPSEGQAPKKVPAAATGAVGGPQYRYGCLWCRKAYTTDTGLMLHIRGEHNIQGKGREVWGTVCPVCGIEHGILGMHTAKVHDGMTITQALMWARDNDDPHKVFAKVFGKVKKYAGKR